jgi:hypothetical protein
LKTHESTINYKIAARATSLDKTLFLKIAARANFLDKTLFKKIAARATSLDMTLFKYISSAIAIAFAYAEVNSFSNNTPGLSGGQCFYPIGFYTENATIC